MKDPGASVRKAALSLHNGYALRDRDFAYMRYRDKTEELYDMNRDPKQFTNQAKIPEYGNQLGRMRKALNGRLKKAGL